MWRWVYGFTCTAARWLTAARLWLGRLGCPITALRFRDDLRVLFLLRGVRRPGMLAGLLTAEAALFWLARLRQALLDRGQGPLAGGAWGFGVHVVEHLVDAPSSTGP